MYYRWTDPIDVFASEKDSRTLMSHQQDAVNSMDEYFKLNLENKENQSGLVVMPTGERVIIVTGCNKCFKSRISGTLIKYNSYIA